MKGFGDHAYEVELPFGSDISLTFNVSNLFEYQREHEIAEFQVYQLVTLQYEIDKLQDR